MCLKRRAGSLVGTRASRNLSTQRLIPGFLVTVLICVVCAPAATGQGEVTIVNTTRGGSTYWVPGDGVQLNITGAAPDSEVTLSYTQNNLSGGPLYEGSTDSDGNFEYKGNTTDENIGTWTQQWYVGGTPVPPILTFSVTPGCPSPLYTSSSPRLYWDETVWHYASYTYTISDLSTGYTNWDGLVTTFANGPLSDAWIEVIDDSGISGRGATQVWDYANGGPGGGPAACYDHPAEYCSGLCADAAKVYYAVTLLNPDNISGQNDLNFVVSHEAGHVFGLDDFDTYVDCANPTVMSVNDELYCQIYVPQYCDLNALGGFYSGWTIWNQSTCSLYYDTSTNCN